MEKHKTSQGTTEAHALSDVIKPKVFSQLSDETQRVAIDAVKSVDFKRRDGGCLGQLFGTDNVCASKHIAFTLCVILVIVGFIIGEKNIWDKIFTIVATTIGYIFGLSKEN